MGKYDDIIDVKWMGSRKHPHMPMKDRAKIFGSFAALKGYEEAIEKKRKSVEDVMESADEFILNMEED